MSDNEHMKQADSNMAYSDSVVDMATVDLGDLWMKRSQVEATLALAYEQRTANLIALFAQGFAGENNFLDRTLGEEGYQEAARQIKQRLGLGD